LVRWAADIIVIENYGRGGSSKAERKVMMKEQNKYLSQFGYKKLERVLPNTPNDFYEKEE